MRDKNEIIEVGVPNYIIRIDKKSGKCEYRKSDYSNKNNWIEPTDEKVIKSLAEYLKDVEEWFEEEKAENEELRNIPQFLSVWRDVKDSNKNTKIFIYDSHMGGWYHTLEYADYDDLYCEQCGDSDNLEWSGTINELKRVVECYI